MLRVMVVDESNEYAELLREGLRDSGHMVVAALSSTIDILAQVERTQPDVIVISVDSPGRDSLEHICVVSQNQPKPIVMFTQERNSNTIQAAVYAGVTAYIVDGLESSRVQSILDVAVARFNQFHALQTELAQTKAEIGERKVIERAKGLLMKQRHWDEDTAFRALRKMAMDRNIRLADAAEQVIAVTKLLN
jgi:two-component system, response regulator / RNA-binding antiterminator